MLGKKYLNESDWPMCRIRLLECIAEKKNQVARVVNYLGYTKEFHTDPIQKMSLVMRKPVLCHMWTTKVQISLRIRAVWSAPLLFAAEMV